MSNRAVPAAEKYAELEALSLERPRCECHGEAMTWSSHVNPKVGGLWRCTPQARARVAAYRKNNSEKVRASKAAWHRANSEKVVAKAAAWRRAHPGRRRETDERRKIKTALEVAFGDPGILRAMFSGDGTALKLIALAFNDGATDSERQQALHMLKKRQKEAAWRLCQTTTGVTPSTQQEQKSPLSLGSSRGE